MTSFLIDECLSRSLADALIWRGYSVTLIQDTELRGEPDNKIFEYAKTNQSVLLTADLDFGNIYSFPLGSHSGIAIVNIPDEMSSDVINREVIKSLQYLAPSDFEGNLIIIEIGRVRIRRHKH